MRQQAIRCGRPKLAVELIETEWEMARVELRLLMLTAFTHSVPTEI